MDRFLPDQKSDHFDAVIVAVPTYAAAQILSTAAPNSQPNSPRSPTALRSLSAWATIAPSANRSRLALDFSCPAAKATAC